MKKILLKVVNMLLVCSFALSSLVTAHTEEKMARHDYKLGLLLSLGIYSSTDAQLVTRGDFVRYFTSLINLDWMTFDVRLPFSDISDDSEYYNSVGVMYSLGVLSYGEKFDANTSIIKPEAAKIIVSFLGYSQEAEAKGGYPVGYLLQLRNLGININYSDGDNLSNNDLIDIFYSVLHAEVNTANIVGDKYKTYRGKDVLSAYHNIDLIKGVITANSISSYTNTHTNCDAGFIRIGNDVFKSPETIPVVGTVSDYLGCSVNAYFKNNDYDYKELVYFDTKGCEIVSLKADSVTGYKNFTIETEDRSSYRLNKGFAFIYNGKAYENFLESDFVFDDGSVTLIDNDWDSLYDVIKIEKIEYLIVDSFSVANRSVTDVNSNLYGFDNAQVIYYDDKSTVYEFFISDGKTKELCDFEDLADYPTLALVISADGKYIKTVGLNNQMNGEIEEIYDGGVVIGGVDYEKSAYSKKYFVKAPGIFIDRIYLTDENKLLGVVYSDNHFRYGYLMKINIESGLGGYKAYILDQTGQKLILDFKSSVNINGEKQRVNFKQTENPVYKVLFDKYQLVKYKVNSEGVITDINTAVSEGLFEKTNNDHLKFYYSSKISHRMVSYLDFIHPYVLPRTTTIFTVPLAIKSNPGSYIFDSSDFYIQGVSGIIGENTVDGEIYDYMDDADAGAIVVYSDTSVDAVSSVPFDQRKHIVDKIVMGIDSEGNIAHKIILIDYTGIFRTYYFSPALEQYYNENNFNIIPGDFVGIVANGDTITGIKRDFDFARWDVESGISKTDSDHYVYYNAGNIYSYKNGVIMVRSDFDGIVRPVVIPMDDTIMKYDKGIKSFKISKISDLKTEVNSSRGEADKIIVRTRYSQRMEAAAYER